MSARGEGIIQTGDREVRLLLTNRALAEVEKRLGKSIQSLFANVQAMGINETAVLLHVGLEAARKDTHPGGKPISMNDAWDVMDEVGWVDVLTVISEALSNVISYSPDKNGADPNA